MADSPRSASLAPATAFAVATFGIFVFSGMDAVMKGLVIAIGVYQTMLWRSLAGVALSGTLYAVRRVPMPGRRAMRLHLTRGMVGAVMALTFFWGLARVSMAPAIALTYIAPVLAMFLSAMLLKETVGRATIVASAIAFAGVGTIVAGQASGQPGPEVVHGLIAILISAICYAFNIVLMRAQALVAGPVEVTFWQSLIVSCALLVAAPWFASIPDARHAPMIVLAAMLATVSMMLLAWAYAHGEASYLAPTEYTSFVWAAMLGWVVFSEPLSLWTLAGAAMIVAGCIVAARRSPSPIPNIEAAP